MAQPIMMRAKLDNGIADVKILIHHPMDTGLMKDPATHQLIPAHFINQVTASLNGKPVMEAQWGIGISKNPFLELKLTGAKAGDTISVSAVDNLGTQFAGQTTLS